MSQDQISNKDTVFEFNSPSIKYENSFFVLSSGSTTPGFNKIIQHDFVLFLNKHKVVPRKFNKTFGFSPVDSIAGFEVLAECLVGGKTLVLPLEKNTPTTVARDLKLHNVDYFQTTPSFLAFVSSHEQWQESNLPSLKHIAFGSEPISDRVLEKIQMRFPNVLLRQTYGMSEVGILKTREDTIDPNYFVLNEQNPGRITNGVLEVQSMTKLRSYVNRDNDSNNRLWFSTGDLAEETPHGLKVFGREGDIFNVGGRKFMPYELEEKLLELPGVLKVHISKRVNTLVGDAIIAVFFLDEGLDEKIFFDNYKSFTQTLPDFMRPHSVKIAPFSSLGERFKGNL
ncbi:MAG: AMP-binding protein [Bdellovibrionales bacterium]|nr:AMP-binding protein [Bdellovibrionales bacterium]